jgi:hypothetical protein
MRIKTSRGVQSANRRTESYEPWYRSKGDVEAIRNLQELKESAPRIARYRPNCKKGEHRRWRGRGWADGDNRVWKGPVERGDQGGKET